MILFDLDNLKLKSKELEILIGKDDFWNNQREAQKTINLFNSINEKIVTFSRLNKTCEDLIDAFLLVKEMYDELMHEDLSNELDKLEKEYEEYSLSTLLNGEYDNSNAIIDIHPGAGGTESQDWADMLYRMYIRFAEKNNFKIQMIDYLEGDGAGLKSVSFMLKGKNVYGLLKAEKVPYSDIVTLLLDYSNKIKTTSK